MAKLNSVHTEIYVDGKVCDWTYMRLDQSMCGHHVFEIGLNYEIREKSVWAHTVDTIFRTTLNKPVSIRMTHTESKETNEFSGMVTDMEAVGLDGDQGKIILRGGSPTILLDRDPSMGSFTDYTLYNVVAATIEQTAIKIAVDNKPKMTRMIPYIARYRETSFAFLSRVLAAYGEWFYYDGKKLVVGRPMAQKEKRLTFDAELSEVRSMAGMRNLNTAWYDYDAAYDYYYEEECTSTDNANFLMKGAKMASDPMYPTEAKLPTDRAILTEDDMTAAVRVKQRREYGRMSSFRARCNSCAVRVGEIAIIHLPDNMEDVFFKDLGAFLVTSVSHRVERAGHYENTFTGIAGVTETLPDDHIVKPQAFPELAIVTANDDPKFHQGRVKVRFLWQPENESTNWIRVQTPDAGSSNAAAKNRGFVFIPEVGDQVMVGFEMGDPSRPYVMGSMFHLRNSKGAAKDNTVKTITTRSGHTVEFNDDEKGDWGIIIKDKNGNTVHLDTKGKNIEITAPETITLTGKNIKLLSEENIELTAKQNMMQTAEKDIQIASKGEITTSSDGDTNIQTKGKLNIGSKDDTSIAAKNISVKGQVEVEIEGQKASVKGQISTVQGASHKIDVM